MNRTNRGARGVTFLELMVVMIVLGLTAAIAWPSFSASRQKAEQKDAIQQLHSLREAVRLYQEHRPDDLATAGDAITDSEFWWYWKNKLKETETQSGYFKPLPDESVDSAGLWQRGHITYSMGMPNGATSLHLYAMHDKGWWAEMTLDGRVTETGGSGTYTPLCGNGILEAGEECERPDAPQGKCNTSCRLNDCGIDTAGQDCNDNNICTNDNCNATAASGICQHSDVSCSDAFSCTVDSCDQSIGCVRAPDNALCDDGMECTVSPCIGEGGEIGTGCHPTEYDDSYCGSLRPGLGMSQCYSGLCAGVPDGDHPEYQGCEFVMASCTEFQCLDVPGHPHDGSCSQCWEMDPSVCDQNGDGEIDAGAPEACNWEPCGDIDSSKPYCNTNWASGGLGDGVGRCQQCLNDSHCPDNQICDRSNSSAFICRPCASPEDCNDGDACTTDTCQGGACQHEPIPDCDPCSFPGSDGQSCSDGDKCTIGDTCSGGTCTAGTPKVCNDDNPCTTDSCMQGVCQFAEIPHCEYCNDPDGTPCEDHDACTQNDTCQGKICTAGEAVNCDDGNECTVDECDQREGCNSNPFPLNGQSCTDEGDVCTTDTCQAGACQHEPISGCCQIDADCEDGNSCTGSSCNTETHICTAQMPLSGISCNDQNACTLGDRCVNGTCAPTGPKLCQASTNPCKISGCNPATGECFMENRPDGTPCCPIAHAACEGFSCEAGICTGPVGGESPPRGGGSHILLPK